MKHFDFRQLALAAVLSVGVAISAAAADPQFEQALLSIQNEWAAANYHAGSKSERRAAFDALVEHSTSLAQRYPTEVEAIAWDGIVLSSYAGVVGKLSAMGYAKAARERLHEAEGMNPTALSGGIYASLGALYSKVPGGLLGFGDDELAESYFKKALGVDAANIDTNYFYGEFLLEQGRAREALPYLQRAAEAPTVAGRPIFDAGRRAEARALIDTAKSKLS